MASTNFVTRAPNMGVSPAQCSPRRAKNWAKNAHAYNINHGPKARDFKPQFGTKTAKTIIKSTRFGGFAPLIALSFAAQAMCSTLARKNGEKKGAKTTKNAKFS